jgi:hypothetical protein
MMRWEEGEVAYIVDGVRTGFSWDFPETKAYEGHLVAGEEGG